MLSLPLFVAYPRSGCHWINTIMELYFDRPRYRPKEHDPSPLAEDRTDYMWLFIHNVKCENVNKLDEKVLYLYRDPVDVLFSHIMYKLNCTDKKYHKSYGTRKKAFGKDVVMKNTKQLQRHCKAYFRYDQVVVIEYERFLNPRTRNTEFAKICKFMNEAYRPLDSECLFKQYERVQEKDYALMGKTPNMLGDNYVEYRKDFREKWEEYIYAKISIWQNRSLGENCF